MAVDVQRLLSGTRPAAETDPNRILYDNLVSVQSPLLKGLDLSRFRQSRDKIYGIAQERFGKAPDDGNIVAAANSVIEIRLPAALFRDREFVVDAKLDGPTDERVVAFRVATSPDGAVRWDGKSPVVASPMSKGYKQLLRGHEEFRQCFPLFVCFPAVVPVDEAVSLKMFHREDEPLNRLFLTQPAEKAARRSVGGAPFYQSTTRSREQLPAAVHRLRDSGSAQGAPGLFRGPAAGFPEAGRRVCKGLEAARARSR